MKERKKERYDKGNLKERKKDMIREIWKKERKIYKGNLKERKKERYDKGNLKERKIW